MKTLPFIFTFIFCLSNLSYTQHPTKLTDKNSQEQDIGSLFVEGVNTISAARQKELVPKVFSKALIDSKGVDALQQLLAKFHNSYAPLEYHHSEIKQRNVVGSNILMHLYAKKQGAVMYQDFQFYLENLISKKINKLMFIAEVSEPISLPNGSIDQKETIDWLNSYVEKLNNEYDLSGCLLIAQGDQVLYEKGFGFADVDRKKKLNSNSLFSMASGGKMFTALAIAKLVEENRISYSDKITKYISGFSDNSMADNISIHHLLSHTSGVAQYWWGQESEEFKNAKTINDHLKMVLNVGITKEAGVEYEYNNSNFILLGAIIEKVTGKDYFVIINELVFQKARMKASGFFSKERKDLVTPFLRSKVNTKEWVSAIPGNGKGSSAGGSYTSAMEMLKFSMALKKELIVSKSSLATMVSQQNTISKDEQYGYGFILEKYDNQISYGHGGTSKGVNFEFRYFPSLDITLVVFSNQDNGAYDDLKRNTIKLITGAR